jgi:2,3-diaminopropionate biosynthesis protein SbnA
MSMESTYLDSNAIDPDSTGGDAIDTTPLASISLVIEGRCRQVYLKLEGANPTGSMKDRTGYALLQDLADRSRLDAGSVIVESTSGNLGVALAVFCQQRNLRFIAVVDPKTTIENLQRLEAFGAQLDMVSEPDATGGYLLSRLARIQTLCAQHPEYIWTNQYANPANPLVHYQSTGPEIYRQMQGQVEAVFVPVSTGGTLAGVGRYLREVSRTTLVIGVDAYGSVIFGTPAARRRLTGIGSSCPSNFLTQDLYDAYMLVGDEEAFAFCRAVHTATGLLVGGSSGAVLAACARYLLVHPTLSRVVCICADDGRNYASSIFNEQWLRQQGIYLTNQHLQPVQAILMEDGE